MTERPSFNRYDDWHDVLEVDTEASAPWHQMIRACSQFRQDMSGKRVLEIGCGRGGFAIWLAEQFYRPRLVCALDLSMVAVAKGRAMARHSCASQVVWGVADIVRLPFSDCAFGAVISCETIEHVGEPRKALRELVRVLRAGGRLYLTVPNYMNANLAYRAYLWLRGRRYSEAGQPKNRMLFLPVVYWWLRRSGLHIRATDGVRHILPLWPGRPAVELRVLERWRAISKWFASQTLLVAEKRETRHTVER